MDDQLKIEIEYTSAFGIYMGKIKKHLKNHFDGNENPPTVERILTDTQEMKKLYIKGWHPCRVVDFILKKAQDQSATYRKKKLQRYADGKYRLALRDNPTLSRSEWAKDFMKQFF